MDAQEGLSHLTDLLRELQQPYLGGNLPVVGAQLADLIPHEFLPKLGCLSRLGTVAAARAQRAG
jgi:hypothetical protein